MVDLTHIDASGRARMVDIGEKRLLRRTARAEGRLQVSKATRGKSWTQACPKATLLKLHGWQGFRRRSRLAS